MFKIIIQLIILIYVILSVYHMINLQKFNMNGFIMDTYHLEEVKQHNTKLNPSIFHGPSTFDINEPNINYIQDIYNYKNNLPSFVFKDKELFERISGPSFILDPNFLNESHFHTPIQTFTTIICGKNNISLKKCIHNHNIIGVLDGEATIYLFNPKHKEELLNKENYQIKKWGHKKKIQKGDILFIPPYWSYIQEINEGIIQYHIDIDTYFTCLPNLLKEIYF